MYGKCPPLEIRLYLVYLKKFDNCTKCQEEIADSTEQLWLIEGKFLKLRQHYFWTPVSQEDTQLQVCLCPFKIRRQRKIVWQPEGRFWSTCSRDFNVCLASKLQQAAVAEILYISKTNKSENTQCHYFSNVKEPSHVQPKPDWSH